MRISWIILIMLLLIFPGGVYAEKESGSYLFFFNLITGPERAIIELHLKNEGDKTLEFETPTSQFYEITINNENEVVYQYSEGKFFLQAIQKVRLKPGETITWQETWDYQREGKRIEPGKYKVEVQFLATSLNGKHLGDRSRLIDQKYIVVTEENSVIKDLKVRKEGEVYYIKGKARPTTGRLFFLVEDGHNEWIKESELPVKAKYPKWGDFSFEIKIPKRKYSNSLPLILYLYEKDKKGKIILSYSKHLALF